MSRWPRLLLAGSLGFAGACSQTNHAQDAVVSRSGPPGTAKPATTTREGVTVERKGPEVKRRTFDPNNPPSDMPKLNGNEAAVTTSSFGVGARVLVSVLGDRRQEGQVVSEVKVEKINVELGLSVTVWLPLRATPALREHEEGHRRIYEFYYERAEPTARGIASAYVGKTFRGEGKDAKAARDAAMNVITTEVTQKYLAALHGPSSKANEEFDRITDHGRNSVPVDRAMDRAIAAAGG